tara:strand:- start:7967 stop:8383 length:417 start_codon:yes stop_codon:yes gene_type:complete
VWFFENTIFEPTQEELEPWVGFVYEITDLSNDKKYIGKKLFWSVRRLPPLKGKKRKRIKRTQSDWMNYYGSNETVKMLVENEGASRFKRNIIRLCKSKGIMSYFEAKEQFDREVLFSDEYYNEFIGVKIHSMHVKGKV